MIEEDWIASAAEQLVAAETAREPIEPFSATVDGLDVATAYRVQRATYPLRPWLGGRRGAKIGLTSLAMQQQLGVETPDFGLLFEGMFVDEGLPVATSELIQPRAEVEFALELRSPLEGDVRREELIAAVSAVRLSVEVIDSRVRDWRITLPDTVADHASSGRVVLGRAQVVERCPDLTGQAVTVRVDGETVAEADGSAVMGDPLQAMAWLVAELSRQGDRLEAGDVVLTGALHASVPVVTGTVVEAMSSSFDDLRVEFA